MKYKTVLFDLGSTLIEFENHDWTTLGKMGILSAHPYLKRHFPNLPEVERFGPTFYQYLREILDGRTDHSEVKLYEACNQIFQRMGLVMTDGIVMNFVKIYYKPVRDQITLIDGADDILKKLKKAGLIVGLVSNSIFPESFHLDEMEYFGLRKYFDFTIFSSAVGMRKPGRKIFDLALEKAGAKNSEAIFIGDRFDADIGGAAASGITSVWKRRADRENPDDIEPDFKITYLSELEAIILT
jgi:HAD superfamily hydrolase (TIGR01509 family)